MEDPDGGEGNGVALAKSTPVAFTSAIACNGTGTTGNPNAGSTTNIET